MADVALLNAPAKDAMAQQILATLRKTEETRKDHLLNNKFATYHEYAAAFEAYEVAWRQREAIERIIKKHLEE